MKSRRSLAQRPELAADYAAKKSDYDAKLKDVDAKRVEALAEDKGVEGTGKEGRGPHLSPAHGRTCPAAGCCARFARNA